MMMENKIYQLTINCQIFATLTPSATRGYCFKCQLEKEIQMVSENPNNWEEKKFCWSCALAKLYELEQGDYQIENKKEVIKEIRENLWGEKPPTEKEERLECYE